MENYYKEGAFCPTCLENNKRHVIKFLYINLHESVLKCESSSCLYPFHGFLIKDDRTTAQLDVDFLQNANEINTDVEVAAVEEYVEEPKENEKPRKLSRCLKKLGRQKRLKIKKEIGEKPKQLVVNKRKEDEEIILRPTEFIRSLIKK